MWVKIKFGIDNNTISNQRINLKKIGGIKSISPNLNGINKVGIDSRRFTPTRGISCIK
jgi:hypothetical protein